MCPSLRISIIQTLTQVINIEIETLPPSTELKNLHRDIGKYKPLLMHSLNQPNHLNPNHTHSLQRKPPLTHLKHLLQRPPQLFHQKYNPLILSFPTPVHERNPTVTLESLGEGSFVEDIADLGVAQEGHRLGF